MSKRSIIEFNIITKQNGDKPGDFMSEKSYLLENLNGKHIHFVGIKGTGIVAMVELLYARKAVITGSDVSERFYTDEMLEKMGLNALPFDEKNITDDIALVIYAGSYKLDVHPELIAAVKKGIPCLGYSEALGLISETAYSLGICGVHGKTTTTGLVGTILKELNLPAQTLAGSIIGSFGNSCTMTTDSALKNGVKYFAAETDEYRNHFLCFCPSKIILTSVESDHQDFFPEYKDIQQAFLNYIARLPKNGQVIYCADDEGAVETVFLAKEKRPDLDVIPYGRHASNDYKLIFGEEGNGKNCFNIACLGDCELMVPGEHLVRNATAAAALCIETLKTEGLDPKDYYEQIKAALKKFAGGKRRSEVVGKSKNKFGKEIIFIDDYGHHPTAVNTTLDGYRKFYGNHKIIIDFMCHTYSRTQALLEEFASSFGNADEVILNKIYSSARENAADFTVTGAQVAECARKYHNSVYYCEKFEEAACKGIELLNEPSEDKYPDGYVFVTMGAGDNWKVGKKIMEKLDACN